MKLAKGQEPKVQRGISLPRDLYERIQADADRFGMTWNEAAERALSRQFPVAANSHKSVVKSIQSGDTVEVV